MRRLLLALFVLLLHAPAAFADLYVLSSTINRRLHDDELVWVNGTARSTETMLLNGTMDVSSAPLVIDMGNRYNIAYNISFDFVFGHDGHLFGTGWMIVDGNGCGLFDCNMAGYGSNDSGNRLFWQVADGAFFYPDGSRYPDVFTSALPYVVPPERFTLAGWSGYTTAGPTQRGEYYFMSGPLMAARVPEPSTLLLFACAIAAFIGQRHRLASPHAGMR